MCLEDMIFTVNLEVSELSIMKQSVGLVSREYVSVLIPFLLQLFFKVVSWSGYSRFVSHLVWRKAFASDDRRRRQLDQTKLCGLVQVDLRRGGIWWLKGFS